LEQIDSILSEAEYFQLHGLISALQSRKKELEGRTKNLLALETKVITLVNSWSSYPGINIDTTQQRIQHAIDEQEKEGWMFVNASTEVCKSREDPSTNTATNVNLIHLFFKNAHGSTLIGGN
jgi:hypothetical protein